MFDRLRKHGMKTLVFIINVLLMAIAALVIREKDQSRFFQNAEKEKGNENTASGNLSSFESSVSIEEQEKENDAESNSSQKDTSIQTSLADNTNVAHSSPVNPPSASLALPSVQNAKPANRKTKTS